MIIQIPDTDLVIFNAQWIKKFSFSEKAKKFGAICLKVLTLLSGLLGKAEL